MCIAPVGRGVRPRQKGRAESVGGHVKAASEAFLAYKQCKPPNARCIDSVEADGRERRTQRFPAVMIEYPPQARLKRVIEIARD